MAWSIRAAEPSDAPQLATFAMTLFRQAYEITHPEPTISEYLASSFSIARFVRTLEDPASTILVVASTNGSWIGYAELHQGPPTAPTTVLTRTLPGTTPIEIVRFYVDQAWHGQGVAQALMRACEERARMRAGDALWLQAWGEAPKALRFYEKVGFEVYGTAVFAFGERADGDLILARGLATSNAAIPLGMNMGHWKNWLFRSHSEATLTSWATRLHLFRFCRAIGGHANDGDSLVVAYRYQGIEEVEGFFTYLGISLVHFADRPAQAKIGVSYPGEEFSKFASLIPGTEWIRQPGHCLIAGQNAFAWCHPDSVRISLSDGYEVTEAQVEAAEALEEVLLGAPLARIDPPSDGWHCICPKYYPAYFG